MQVKRIAPLVIILFVISVVVVWKTGQQQTTGKSLLPISVKGPAVILFRGDNSPGCRAIDQLVEKAEERHGEQINFTQLDWSARNPLINKYQIRFLPTVIFINKHDIEVGRIIGESPAIQQKLKQTLTQLKELLG